MGESSGGGNTGPVAAVGSPVAGVTGRSGAGSCPQAVAPGYPALGAGVLVGRGAGEPAGGVVDTVTTSVRVGNGVCHSNGFILYYLCLFVNSSYGLTTL